MGVLRTREVTSCHWVICTRSHSALSVGEVGARRAALSVCLGPVTSPCIPWGFREGCEKQLGTKLTEEETRRSEQGAVLVAEGTTFANSGRPRKKKVNISVSTVLRSWAIL